MLIDLTRDVAEHGTLAVSGVGIDTEYTTKLIAALSGTVPVNNPFGIDTISADSLGCHDGVLAQKVKTVFKNYPIRRSHLTGSDHQMISMDHPVGIDYSRYATASKEYKSLFGICN